MDIKIQIMKLTRGDFYTFISEKKANIFHQFKYQPNQFFFYFLLIPMYEISISKVLSSFEHRWIVFMM